MGKDLYRHFTKDDMQMSNKHMKRCSTSFVINKMNIKIRNYHYISIRMAKIQNTDKPNADKDIEQQELSYIACGNAK